MYINFNWTSYLIRLQICMCVLTSAELLSSHFYLSLHDVTSLFHFSSKFYLSLPYVISLFHFVLYKCLSYKSVRLVFLFKNSFLWFSDRLYSKSLGSKSSRRSLEDRDFTDTSARQEYMTRTWPRHFTPRFSTEYNLNYPYN